jgi:hypothetical protein
MSQRAAAGGEAEPSGEPQRQRVRTGRTSRRPRARSRVSYPRAGRSGGKTPWRPAPTGVEKPGDDPRVGVKGLTNPEISRSPRNGFRASPGRSAPAVEPPDPLGGLAACRREPNSERRRPQAGSQDARAKPRAREGNSPDRPPRPPSPRRVAKDVRLRRQPGRWPRSSHPSKECVTAHWPSWRAPTIHGAKRGAEAAGPGTWSPGGRGASRARRSRPGEGRWSARE